MAALIAGLLAGCALLTMYLLKLRRRPLWVSSTLFWEAGARDLEVNVPLRWIRASWLLLLHALIVACVVLAIGRPTIASTDASAARVILLIDRSLSMSALDAPDGVSRLEQAKASARQIIADLRRTQGASAAVITFAARAEAVTPMTSDWSLIESAIASIAPTDQSGAGVASALDLASTLLGEAGAPIGDAAAEPSRVLLIGDGDVESPTLASLPGATLEFVRVGPAERAHAIDNIGIVASAARRAEDDPTIVRVFARLQSMRAEPTSVVVRLLVDGTPQASTAATVPGTLPSPPAESPAESPPESPPESRADSVVESPGAASATPSTIEPGTTTVLLDVPLARGGLLTLTIERSDLIQSDNSVHLRVEPLTPTRVLLVTPGGGAGEPDAWPITDVLSELPMTIVRIISGDAWAGASASTREELFADLVILSNVAPGRPIAVPMLVFGGPPGLPGPGAVRSRLASEQADPATDEGNAGIGRILAWEREHPLMRGVTLDTVVIGESLVFEAPDDAERSARVVPLIRAEPGDPLVAVDPLDRSTPRAILVGFTLDQSTWPLTFAWPLFLDNAMDWLTRRSERAQGIAYRTSDSIQSPVEALGSASASVLEGPEGQAGPARTVRIADGIASIGLVERAGLYRLSQGPAQGSDADLPSLPIPVNVLDARESAARSLDVVRLGTRSIESTTGQSRPREIWHWFILAAACMLMLEWIVFAWRARI